MPAVTLVFEGYQNSFTFSRFAGADLGPVSFGPWSEREYKLNGTFVGHYLSLVLYDVTRRGPFQTATTRHTVARRSENSKPDRIGVTAGKSGFARQWG